MQVIKIPFGVGSLGKNNGTKKAPDEIEKATKEIYLSELGKLPVFSFQTKPADAINAG